MEQLNVATCRDLFEKMALHAHISSTDDPKKLIPKWAITEIHWLLGGVGHTAYPANLPETQKCALRLMKDFEFDVTCGELTYALRHLMNLMQSEFERRLVLVVDERDAQFHNKERLFGDQVYEAFPSAREDIREAGNCLACGCATACVFHLMRAAEIALRVLAWDRRVKFMKRPELPIELRQWDELLQELETSERKIQQYKQSIAREAQLAFYHGALVQLRAFKNLYRHRTAHARKIYDINQARSAMTHVSEFMKILGMKISESKRTPLVWKKAQL